MRTFRVKKGPVKIKDDCLDDHILWMYDLNLASLIGAFFIWGWARIGHRVIRKSEQSVRNSCGGVIYDLCEVREELPHSMNYHNMVVWYYSYIGRRRKQNAEIDSRISRCVLFHSVHHKIIEKASVESKKHLHDEGN